MTQLSEIKLKFYAKSKTKGGHIAEEISAMAQELLEARRLLAAEAQVDEVARQAGINPVVAEAYMQGYHDSESRRPQPVQVTDGWIKCSEHMPSVGELVLAYRPDAPESNDPLIKMATYVGKSAHGHGFDCYCKPSHWMPLPVAPHQQVKP